MDTFKRIAAPWKNGLRGSRLFLVLAGPLMAAVWIGPGKADDCTSTETFERTRVVRAFDTRLSDLRSYAANPDQGGTKLAARNLAAIERRLRTLRKGALRRIGKAARACVRNGRVDRISEVADFYVLRKLQAAIPGYETQIDRTSSGAKADGSSTDVSLAARSLEHGVPRRDSARPVEERAASAPTTSIASDRLDVSADAPGPQPLAAPALTAKAEPAAVPPVRPKLAPEPALKDDPPVNPILKTLAAAPLSFDHPAQLRLDNAQSFRIKLKAMPEADAAILDTGSDDGQGQKRLAATLLGGDGLAVVPSDPQAQWLSRSDSTEWHWEITPKAVGRQTLTLILNAVTTVDGEETLRPVRTVTHEVDVDESVPVFSPGDWIRALSTQLKSIGGLWPMIFIVIGLVFLRWRRRSHG